jgi:hypothetical protein
MAIEKFKKLIKFLKPENSAEYFEYTDDPEIEEIQPRGGRRLFAFSFYGALLTLGITFGANIVINSTSGSGIEFGQGVSQTVNCQGTTNITVTPYAGFQNASGGGLFGLDSIILENIHQNCVNKDFIIKLWEDTSNTPLVLTDSTTASGPNETFTATRFHWSDSVTVSVMGSQFTDVELMNDTSTSTDFTTNATALLISFDADPNNTNLANTKNVYKITVETAPHTGATS